MFVSIVILEQRYALLIILKYCSTDNKQSALQLNNAVSLIFLSKISKMTFNAVVVFAIVLNVVVLIGNSEKDDFNHHEPELQCEHNVLRFDFKALPTSTMPVKKVAFEADNCRVGCNSNSCKYERYTTFATCSTSIREEEDHIVYSNIARVYYTNETTLSSLISKTKIMNIKSVFVIDFSFKTKPTLWIVGFGWVGFNNV